MKKILVTGANSYIGKSFEAYAKNKYQVTMLSIRNNEWKSFDFTGFDSVLHCAGIAHIKQTRANRDLYYKVNCDLAVEVANKAKASGVKQFIYLSSMAAYKNDCDCDYDYNYYGDSKLKAENELQALADDGFKICIVRPPMVYGKGCKGNFIRLAALSQKTPVFPDYTNKRSMIYIDNLCEFLCNVIDKVENKNVGIFTPQNSEYVCTTELVRLIRASYGKSTRTTKLFNPIVKLLANNVGVIGKMFGDLTYELSGDEGEYNVVDFEESVKLSIR